MACVYKENCKLVGTEHCNVCLGPLTADFEKRWKEFLSEHASDEDPDIAAVAARLLQEYNTGGGL